MYGSDSAGLARLHVGVMAELLPHARFMDCARIPPPTDSALRYRNTLAYGFTLNLICVFAWCCQFVGVPNLMHSHHIRSVFMVPTHFSSNPMMQLGSDMASYIPG